MHTEYSHPSVCMLYSRETSVAELTHLYKVQIRITWYRWVVLLLLDLTRLLSIKLDKLILVGATLDDNKCLVNQLCVPNVLLHFAKNSYVCLVRLLIRFRTYIHVGAPHQGKQMILQDMHSNELKIGDFFPDKTNRC